MDENNLKRCFIALEMPREVINYIEEVQDLLRKKGLFYGKFTEPENLHLTLKFLGEIDEENIEKVKEKLKEIKFDEFEAELGEIGLFSEKIIRIIWIKLNGKPIFQLQKNIDDKLGDIFKKEERFMSHITIARVKKVPDKVEMIDYIKKMKTKKIKFKVKEFCLKKSELMPEGPVYSDIEKYYTEKS